MERGWVYVNRAAALGEVDERFLVILSGGPLLFETVTITPANHVADVTDRRTVSAAQIERDYALIPDSAW